MKVLKIILIVIISLAALFVIIGLFLPSKNVVERSVIIKAPDYVVFEQIDSLKNMNKWSPWNKYDTNMVTNYEGTGRGKGAAISWTSAKKDIGSGKMTITESKPFNYIECSLNFMGKGQAKDYFKIITEGENTKVTWGLETDFGGNIFARYLGLFLDAMVGKDFSEGLTGLKKISEEEAVKTVKLKMSIETLPVQFFYSIADSSSLDENVIKEKFSNDYRELGIFLTKNGYNPFEKPPVAISNHIDMRFWSFEAALGVPDNKVAPTGRIKATLIPSGKALKTVYIGTYENMEATYKYIFQYINGNEYVIAGRSWEVYVNDPGNTSPDKLETDIYFPIAETSKGK